MGRARRFADGSCLARRRIRLTEEAFRSVKDLDKLLVGEELIKRLSVEREAKKAFMFWKADDPVAALRAIAEDQAAVRNRILELFESEPTMVTAADADGSGARTRQRKEPERLAQALERYRAETGRRSALMFERRTLVLMGWSGRAGEYPRLAYETKGNAWLDVGLDGSGKPYWRAIPRIEAMQAPLREDPLGLRIYAGDTLEITNADGRRVPCRVLSISTGDVQLLPVNDARQPKQSTNRNAYRFTSVRKFLAAEPVQVVRDPLGHVVWRGRRRNW